MISGDIRRGIEVEGLQFFFSWIALAAGEIVQHVL